MRIGHFQRSTVANFDAIAESTCEGQCWMNFRVRYPIIRIVSGTGDIPHRQTARQYSTVTALTRFLGRSTPHPRWTAMW